MESEFCQDERVYDSLLQDFVVLLDRIHTDTEYDIYWIVQRSNGKITISVERYLVEVK